MGRLAATARRLILLAVVAAGLVACSGAAPADSVSPTAAGVLESSEPFGLTTATLRDPTGDETLTIPVYDAFAGAARQRGLMHRRELPQRAGMVFRFPDDHSGGFWMKDTLIPLSIAFFDADGTVLAVLDMPPCAQLRCPSYDPKVSYRGALEVNEGFFDEVGLEPGWVIDLPAGLPAPS